MLIAAIYLVITGGGFLLLHAVIRRSTRPRPGAVYLRAALGLSSCFVAMDLIIGVMFGAPWIPLSLAVGLGFAMPGVMLAMT